MNASFYIGQTVTVRGTEIHAVVTDVYTYQGKTKVTIRQSYKRPAVTFDAHELTPYVVQSPDCVILMADDGTAWYYEVLDVSADGLRVCLNDDGLGWYPLSEVSRVIPASIARLMSLVGGES